MTATEAPPSFSSRRRVLLLLGAAALLGAFLVAQSTLILQARGLRPDLPTVIANFVNGQAWAGLAPLAVALARRFPVVGPRWGRHLLIHVGAALLADAVVGALVLLVTRPIDLDSPPVGFLFVNNFLISIPFYALLWLVVVAGTHALDYARRSREREQRATALEAQLAHAQLAALRMQLNPHFLFNTLHAVSTLMGRDVPAARSMLADLSDLLRLSLDRAGEQEVPLDEELDFLRHYLQIERTRFRDRLVIEEAVAPETRGALVPSLLLQPLVENAIKHGVAPRGEGGHVTITARREGDRLVVCVEDDGPGLRGDAPLVEGVGVPNTRERLARLYGADATFVLEDRTEGGLRAEVRLPFHLSPLSAA